MLSLLVMDQSIRYKEEIAAQNETFQKIVDELVQKGAQKSSFTPRYENSTRMLL
jgi:mannitol/fructose-specific phosphotransferase system IIA component